MTQPLDDDPADTLWTDLHDLAAQLCALSSTFPAWFGAIDAARHDSSGFRCGVLARDMANFGKHAGATPGLQHVAELLAAYAECLDAIGRERGLVATLSAPQERPARTGVPAQAIPVVAAPVTSSSSSFRRGRHVE